MAFRYKGIECDTAAEALALQSEATRPAAEGVPHVGGVPFINGNGHHPVNRIAEAAKATEAPAPKKAKAGKPKGKPGRPRKPKGPPNQTAFQDGLDEYQTKLMSALAGAPEGLTTEKLAAAIGCDGRRLRPLTEGLATFARACGYPSAPVTATRDEKLRQSVYRFNEDFRFAVTPDAATSSAPAGEPEPDAVA